MNQNSFIFPKSFFRMNINKTNKSFQTNHWKTHKTTFLCATCWVHLPPSCFFLGTKSQRQHHQGSVETSVARCTVHEWGNRQQAGVSLNVHSSGWPLVGNEGINLYIGILGMKLPSFPTKGQLVIQARIVFWEVNVDVVFGVELSGGEFFSREEWDSPWQDVFRKKTKNTLRKTNSKFGSENGLLEDYFPFGVAKNLQRPC